MMTLVLTHYSTLMSHFLTLPAAMAFFSGKKMKIRIRICRSFDVFVTLSAHL